MLAGRGVSGYVGVFLTIVTRVFVILGLGPVLLLFEIYCRIRNVRRLRFFRAGALRRSS
jgi:hypothetical protein